MSTRSQIEFSVKGEVKNPKGKVEKYNDGKVLIYRHSDGYPDGEHGVVESLKRFFNWNGGRNDLEYMTANFILFEKLSSIANSNKMYRKMIDEAKKGEEIPEWWKIHTVDDIMAETNDHNANWLLGYGICQPNAVHWDIEYFYNVEVYRKHSGFNSKDTVTIKVRKSQKGRIVEKHTIEVK